MRIWVTQTGEPYPFLAEAPLMRTGLLVNELVARGHEVLWWGACFAHLQRRQLCRREQERQLGPQLRIRLLAGHAYTRSVSLRRLLHHRRLARRFVVHSRSEPRPDLILTSLPVHDLAYRAVQYGLRTGTPVLVDVRDLWPDSFLTRVPGPLRALARLALAQDFHRARTALSGATGLVAVSTTFLDWALAQAGRPRSVHDAVFYIGGSALAEASANEQQLVARLGWVSAPGNRVVLVFLGTFGQTYDLDLVLEAAARLEQQGDDRCHFLLAGHGERWPALARQAAARTNVTLCGWLGAEEIRILLRRGQIGLAPYVDGAPQSLPNKPFSYLSAGLPVISSLPGELAGLLDRHECGMTYQAGDADSLVAAIRRVCGDRQLREQLAAGARRFFRSLGDAARINQAYAAHLERVALGTES